MEKLYTVRELSAQFGCKTKIVQSCANKLFGANTRYFDEVQATALLESIKHYLETECIFNIQTEMKKYAKELKSEPKLERIKITMR